MLFRSIQCKKLTDREAFEEFFHNAYVPVEYKMVKKEFEEVAGRYGRNIFTEEYLEKGRIDKKDYILYMNTDAYCELEGIVEETVDDLNQDIVDVIMEVGNEIAYDNNTVAIYYDMEEKLLKEFLDHLYDMVLFRIS